MSTTPLSAEDRNILRCHAHEIIIKLMDEGDRDSLEMLQMHVRAALDRLTPAPPTS